MSSTFFIFLSLQFLNNHQDAFNVIVTCAHERMLPDCHGRGMPTFAYSMERPSAKTFVCSRLVFPVYIRQSTMRSMSTAYCDYGHISKLPCLAPLYTLLDVDLSMGDLEFCQREIGMQLEFYSNKAQFVAMRLMLVADFLHHVTELALQHKLYHEKMLLLLYGGTRSPAMYHILFSSMQARK